MHRSPKPVPGPRRLAALAPLLLVAGCVSAANRSAEVAALVREGHYAEAVERSNAWVESSPNSEEAAEAHRIASAAWLLEQGRRLTFEDEDEEALEYFERALAIAPDERYVRAWYDKTLRKLADFWLDVAHELETHDLAEALETYERVLGWVPDHPTARAAAARVLLLMNYRQGLGETYYKEGVRDLRNYRLYEARGHFGHTQKYLPADEAAEERKEEVESLLAQERVAIARGFEEDGLYPAAYNEYRLAQILDPELEAAKRGRERMEPEVEVDGILTRVRMLRLQDRLEEAREELSLASELAELQAEEVAAARRAIEEARLERMYVRARDLERDYRFEEAVAAFDELLADAGFFRDAVSRRDTLVDFVELAAELYGEAEAAEDDAVELDLLEQIAVFWPEYRDVEARIAELRARLEG